MEISGQCFCGAVAYTAVVDPSRIGVCHCRDCQIFSGSAFRMTAACPTETFTFVRGEPKTFDKTADSGKIRRQTFCGECGTHLCARSADDTDDPHVSIRLSTCDQFADLTPSFELFCDSRVDWMPPIAGAEPFARMKS